MVILNVSYAEKDEAKTLGAKWDMKARHWYVPDGMNLAPFKKWLPDIEEKSFSDFLSSVGKEVKAPTQLYKFKADVHDVYRVDSGAFYLFTLLTEHMLNRTIKVKVPANLLEGKTDESFIDKEVEVIGSAFVYSAYLTFQVEAISFQIVGECSRKKKLQEWEKTCEKILGQTGASDSYSKLPKVERIGLIANSSTEGYFDFMNRLNALHTTQYVKIIFKDVKMNAEEIINAISELNAEEECDAICIVRGGGDPEYLIEYSKPELLEAIAHSRTPVIVGIGHANDELLCKRVAFHAAISPTDAANYINTQVRSKIKEKQVKYFNEKMGQKEKDVNYWENRCKEAESEVESLTAEIESLNAKIAELTQKKKPGFISRIFNW